MSEILIVEDHPVFANGLQKLILDKGITKKCSVVYCIQDCLKHLKIYTPNLILLDYKLPDGKGNDLCKTIKQSNNKIKILAISSFSEQSVVNSMIDSGASGYVLKNATEDEITDAIISVLAGKQYFYDELQEIIDDDYNPVILSNREIEVLRFIADGLTNIEIGKILFISPLTVDSHRRNLILKLNAKNTASLINIAIHKGYI
jgi:DNA-binding NarL/FixJ family response regulator